MRRSINNPARVLCFLLAFIAAGSTALVAHSGYTKQTDFPQPGGVNERRSDSDAAETEGRTDSSTFPSKSSESFLARAGQSYGQIPLSFEVNEGQTDRRVKFLSRGNGYNLFLTSDEAVLALHKPASRTANDEAAGSGRRLPGASSVLRMRLAGASRNANASGASLLTGTSNYLIGSDKKRWRRNIPTYASVKYEAIYPGIDLVYYGTQRQLEYDFIVSPGADPSRIKLDFEGTSSIRISREGDLILGLGGEEVRQLAPIAYQEIEGARRNVACKYAVRDHRVSFELGAYDRTSPLVIDPLLIYSTFLGGAAHEVGFSVGVGVESNGTYTYVAGVTRSVDFPTTPGAYQRSYVWLAVRRLRDQAQPGGYGPHLFHVHRRQQQ